MSERSVWCGGAISSNKEEPGTAGGPPLRQPLTGPGPRRDLLGFHLSFSTHDIFYFFSTIPLQRADEYLNCFFVAVCECKPTPYAGVDILFIKMCLCRCQPTGHSLINRIGLMVRLFNATHAAVYRAAPEDTGA